MNTNGAQLVDSQGCIAIDSAAEPVSAPVSNSQLVHHSEEGVVVINPGLLIFISAIVLIKVII